MSTSRTRAATRRIGLSSAVVLVIANMLGTGVFTTSGFSLADLGSRQAVLVAWAAFIVVGILREPSSHNLWPLELILWAAAALAVLGLLALLKRITHQ